MNQMLHHSNQITLVLQSPLQNRRLKPRPQSFLDFLKLNLKLLALQLPHQKRKPKLRLRFLVASQLLMKFQLLQPRKMRLRLKLRSSVAYHRLKKFQLLQLKLMKLWLKLKYLAGLPLLMKFQ